MTVGLCDVLRVCSVWSKQHNQFRPEQYIGPWEPDVWLWKNAQRIVGNAVTMAPLFSNLHD